MLTILVAGLLQIVAGLLRLGQWFRACRQRHSECWPALASDLAASSRIMADRAQGGMTLLVGRPGWRICSRFLKRWAGVRAGAGSAALGVCRRADDRRHRQLEKIAIGRLRHLPGPLLGPSGFHDPD